MTGILDEIFRMRTKGNGYIEQEWDHSRKEASKKFRVREEQQISGQSQLLGNGSVTSQTGDIYEYTRPWEGGVPRSYRLTPDALDS